MIIITGPSASGKTDLAIKVAKKVGTNILSADSRQIYKNLEYSTGKLPVNFDYSKKHGYWGIEGIKYFGYDITNEDKEFSAGDFVDFANSLDNEYKIVCGGTGLYISALIGNTTLNKTPKNTLLRKKLENKTAEVLLKVLEDLNFNTANLNNSEKNNKQRLVRKIEIESFKRDKPINGLSLKGTVPVNNSHTIVGLNTGNYETKIENWVNKNFENIKKEVLWLSSKYPNSPVFKGFIFAEMQRYVNGEIDVEVTKKLIYYSYRQYIKRQMTYFNKHFPNAKWFSNHNDAKKYILDLF